MGLSSSQKVYELRRAIADDKHSTARHRLRHRESALQDSALKQNGVSNSYRCFSAQSRPDIIESLESRLANRADCAACHRAAMPGFRSRQAA
jgi:hypothetical protein